MTRLPRLLARLSTGTALALALSAASVGPAFAQDQVPLATVNGVAITAADVEAARGQIESAIPPQVPAGQRENFIIDFLVDAELLAQDAVAKGLAEGPDYEARVERMRKRALMEAALADNLRAGVTDETVRAFYDVQVAAAPKQEEVRARHILVETEEEAEAVVARLEAGEAFETVADELTIDPSGKGRGGDLGYFGRGRMVPAFETAVFALEPGGVSDPVQSQFGFHVIRLEDRREIAPPPFERIEPQVREALGRQSQADYVSRLRESAEIVRAEAEAEAAPEADAETEADVETEATD